MDSGDEPDSSLKAESPSVVQPACANKQTIMTEEVSLEETSREES